uniref:Uncharacterized protein n=1 Tax=Siphoviridae sp. ct5lU19 TaxID=2827780 RepID=A0A8S5SAY6_9CAUD|nr:MAG TPA: hypothetical protein [Siphoviridae sp. ct5lU19]
MNPRGVTTVNSFNRQPETNTFREDVQGKNLSW